MLTYTDEFDDKNENYNRSQWVIDNYEKYKPMLNDIKSYVQDFELNDEMYVIINKEVVNDNLTVDGIRKLYGLSDRPIRLSKIEQNSSKVVDGKIMIKGIGIYDKKYFKPFTF